MKRISIIFLFVLVIISHQNIIFASYNSESIGDELHQHIENIFKERSRIWNQFLLGQYISMDEIEKDLNKIVVGPLLKSDIEMFRQMLSNPTSYEGISDVSINDIDLINSGVSNMTLKVKALWQVSEYENEYTEEVEYNVEMKKVNNNWLLSDYQLNE